MPQVRPFRALRFSLPHTGAPANVVAPPLDGLDGEVLEALQGKSPHNVVHLLSHHVSPDETAARFGEWLTSGVLDRDGEPALYAYEQTWTGPAGRRTRRGFFGLLGLRAGPRKVLLPHERGADTTARDRLQAVRAHLTPVLALYEDPSGGVDAVLTSARSAFPDIALTDDGGVEHRLFPVNDTFALQRVGELLEHRTLLLGDGQEHYEAALALRDGHHGASAEAGPADFVLTYFCNSADAGLAVRPFHCVLEGLPEFEFTPFIKSLETWFDLEQVRSIRDVDAILAALAMASRRTTAFAIIGGGAVGRRSGYIASLDVVAARERLDAAGGLPLHHTVDPTVLNELILREALGIPIGLDGRAHGVDYLVDEQTAMARGRSKTTQLVILRHPVALQALFRLCQDGGHVARPVAHFYPPCLSGLVFSDQSSS